VWKDIREKSLNDHLGSQKYKVVYFRAVRERKKDSGGNEGILNKGGREEGLKDLPVTQ